MSELKRSPVSKHLVEIRGLTPDGDQHGAMRFHLATRAGEELWFHEFPARLIGAPPSPFFRPFAHSPAPADFDHLGYWWRHFPTGPTWSYAPPTWMLPPNGRVPGRAVQRD
ncbi:hypothetical protein [Nocardiopsis sp. CC223A]|uniref:hypothetical protein n=1 Tax=Nocardiopsis sp. CC223A TaxID=3044051 RepID=UPI00278C3B76|nr:hypothetical protein [Nocardiopsis sp. CC223A]